MDESFACNCAAAGARERRWSDAEGEHIDVRGLSPPQPLVAIVRLIEDVVAAGTPRAVIAHLDRDPVMLYPELVERGWAARALPAGPGEVRLRLVRDGTSP